MKYHECLTFKEAKDTRRWLLVKLDFFCMLWLNYKSYRTHIMVELDWEASSHITFCLGRVAMDYRLQAKEFWSIFHF